MNLLAIDPGNVRSAYVIYRPADRRLLARGILPNEEMLIAMEQAAWDWQTEHLAIEMVACYGMAVGKTVFDTCVWVGRFIQQFGGPYNKVLRKGRWGPGAETTGAEGIYGGVAMTLCRNNTAKDSNIRRALLDRFPATGGGATPQVGTKPQPGPLHGVKEDMWAALAVAVTWAECTGQGLEAAK